MLKNVQLIHGTVAIEICLTNIAILSGQQRIGSVVKTLGVAKGNSEKTECKCNNQIRTYTIYSIYTAKKCLKVYS